MHVKQKKALKQFIGSKKINKTAFLVVKFARCFHFFAFCGNKKSSNNCLQLISTLPRHGVSFTVFPKHLINSIALTVSACDDIPPVMKENLCDFVSCSADGGGRQEDVL